MKSDWLKVNNYCYIINP